MKNMHDNLVSCNRRWGFVLLIVLTFIYIRSPHHVLACDLEGKIAKARPIQFSPGYEHDKWKTRPCDIIYKFRAYRASFDSDDDNDGDGVSDKWAIPEWVAFEVRKSDGFEVSGSRPSEWMTDEDLADLVNMIAPKDSSYKFEQTTRDQYPYNFMYGFSRGHMCPKSVAKRLGPNAEYNTHVVVNACPQRQWFNNGIWKNLEELTEKWSDHYERVWVICGPLISKGKVKLWLGEEGEKKVAVPDAFWKIIVKESNNPNRPDVLAFIYPHAIKPSDNRKPYKQHKFLVSVDEIEKRTGLDFFTRLSTLDQTAIEQIVASELWVLP